MEEAQVTESPVTSEEAKAKLIADMEKEYTSEDPIEMAAKMFGTYLPYFKAKMRELSAAEMGRVAIALVEHPLGDRPHMGITQQEREAFALGNSLLDAKMVLIMNEMANKEQAKLELQANTKDESNGNT